MRTHCSPLTLMIAGGSVALAAAISTTLAAQQPNEPRLGFEDIGIREPFLRLTGNDARSGPGGAVVVGERDGEFFAVPTAGYL